MDQVKIAFVGTGWIADWHFAALKERTDAVLVGACDAKSRFPECKARCAEWGVKAYEDFDALLEAPDVDALYILSPTAFHFDQTLRAVAKKKHVLVEKPVALRIDQIDSMKRAAREQGVTVFPAHNFVYRPVVRKAKEVLESGALGTVSFASFRAVHFIPEQCAVGWRVSLEASGGGAMIDSGTHLVYQSLYLMGAPTKVSAFSAKKHYLGLESEDICQISGQYQDGSIAHILQSWASGDGSSGEIRIQGDKATLLITDALYLDGKKVADDAAYGSSFGHTAEAFVECTKTGKSPLSTLDDAATTLKLIQSAYEAARTDRVITL